MKDAGNERNVFNKTYECLHARNALLQRLVRRLELALNSDADLLRLALAHLLLHERRFRCGLLVLVRIARTTSEHQLNVASLQIAN